MFETVDLYCERTSSAFWAEPVNALTNGLFLIAAWFAWRRAHRLDAEFMGIWLLLGLMCAIGIGSFLFHTFATTWARWVDVLPILLFQLLYTWLYCREVIRIRLTYVFAIVLAYCIAAFIARGFPHVLSGSLTYAPAWVFLLAVGIFHSITRRRERFIILGAFAAFVVALTARTLDNTICPHFPLGTHFMWHICNALVLYLMMRGLLANHSALSIHSSQEATPPLCDESGPPGI